MIDTELTVAYINGRIQDRIRTGLTRSNAILETLAALDEDLYTKVIKEGAHVTSPDLFTDYLTSHYSNFKG